MLPVNENLNCDTDYEVYQNLLPLNKICPLKDRIQDRLPMIERTTTCICKRITTTG